MKLFAISPFPTDATSFYRGMGVMDHLETLFNGKLEIIKHRNDQNESNIKLWNELQAVDILFCQRPHSEKFLTIMEYFKKHFRRPIWIDYDDNLFELPKYNRAHKYYEQNLKTRDILLRCMKLADVITVTTVELQRYLAPIHPNVMVIPNAFPNYTVDISDRNPLPRENRIFWRGSGTHIGDVDYFKTEIQTAMSGNKDHKFTFVGSDISELYWFFDDTFFPNNIGNSELLDPLDPYDYLYNIKTVAAKACHVPLVYNLFNLSKSNVAALEAAWGGMAVIAPDWIEWDMPGVLKYKTKEDYLKQLNAVCRNEVDVEKLSNQTWQYICDNLLLTKVNVQRMKLIKSLL